MLANRPFLKAFVILIIPFAPIVHIFWLMFGPSIRFAFAWLKFSRAERRKEKRWAKISNFLHQVSMSGRRLKAD